MAKCPVCKSDNIKLHNHNLAQCLDCTHIFQADLEISMEYNDEYMKNYDKYPTETMAHLRSGFVIAHLDNTKLESEQHKVLDVGYGTGSFLKVMEKYGTEVYGADIHGVDYGIKEVGLDCKIPFSVITFFDSLEHFEKFDQVLSLKTDTIIISIPYAPSWFLDDPKAWRHYKPGEHLHYFSLKSLNHLLSSKGYDLVKHCFLEDVIRGKIVYNEAKYDNILTAVYKARKKQ